MDRVHGRRAAAIVRPAPARRARVPVPGAGLPRRAGPAPLRRALRPPDLPLAAGVPEQVNAQATVLVYGSGRLTLTPDGAESSLQTDMTNAMAAFGGRGVLSVRSGEAGQFELALRSDAMLTDTASVAVAGLSAGEGATSRIRLILEGSGSVPAFGGVLAPRVEAGLRYDGGDAETGAGLEVGGGLAYDKARLTVQVDGRVLLTHRDRDYEEWDTACRSCTSPPRMGAGCATRRDPSGARPRAVSATATSGFGWTA